MFKFVNKNPPIRLEDVPYCAVFSGRITEGDETYEGIFLRMTEGEDLDGNWNDIYAIMLTAYENEPTTQIRFHDGKTPVENYRQLRNPTIVEDVRE